MIVIMLEHLYECHVTGELAHERIELISEAVHIALL